MERSFRLSANSVSINAVHFLVGCSKRFYFGCCQQTTGFVSF
jgi:hypothetical protein